MRSSPFSRENHSQLKREILHHLLIIQFLEKSREGGSRGGGSGEKRAKPRFSSRRYGLGCVRDGHKFSAHLPLRGGVCVPSPCIWADLR